MVTFRLDCGDDVSSVSPFTFVFVRHILFTLVIWPLSHLFRYQNFLATNNQIPDERCRFLFVWFFNVPFFFPPYPQNEAKSHEDRTSDLHASLKKFKLHVCVYLVYPETEEEDRSLN